jgi:hypothetical protein
MAKMRVNPKTYTFVFTQDELNFLDHVLANVENPPSYITGDFLYLFCKDSTENNLCSQGIIEFKDLE